MKIDNKPIIYHLYIPRGYKASTATYENERIKIFLYSDSSSFFFSDKIIPSTFPADAYLKYGKDLYITFLSSDTLIVDGRDEQGRYWEDRKIKYIIYGYRKVPVGKKEMYDNVLNNIVIKK